MRTLRQGQAAVSEERGGRRRGGAEPEALPLGRGKTSPGLSQITVERYPDPSPATPERSGLPWARRVHGFLLLCGLHPACVCIF